MLILCVSLFALDIQSDIDIVRVYDGDTFYVDINGWPELVGKNMPIRIAGIDTPEIRTRDKKEKRLAMKAKVILEGLLRNADILELKNCKRGKYFRIVADVYVDGVNVAEILIEHGLAYEYDGGTKHPPW
jgi:endonuclease YncB( thermonuclease family)